MTANISLDGLAIRIRERVSSRIAGMGKIVHVLGPDFKAKKQGEFLASSFWEHCAQNELAI